MTMVKKLFYFLLIFVLFHIGLVIPKTKFECSCHTFSSEVFSPCCNCPSCVNQRCGFLSACGCHEKTERSSERLPVIKRAICFCGPSSADFELPGVKYPILLGENLFSLPTLEIHHFLSISSALSSQVYLTPPEHPS